MTRRTIAHFCNMQIKVIATAHALHFIDKNQLQAETGVVVHTDEDEWSVSG